MKVRIISDIHLEFGKYEVPSLGTDKETVLIIPGDINPISKLYDGKNSSQEFFDSLTGRFKQVVVVPGNHCYWSRGELTLWEAEEALKKFFDQYDDITLLNNDVYVGGGVPILGTTLWTDCDRSNPIVMHVVGRSMNDYRQIKGCTAEETIKTHQEARKWLTTTLVNYPGSIVVTHHLPSFQCVDKAYRTQANYYMNFGYFSDMEDVMLSFNPKLWVYGHSHSPMDFTIGRTRVINNARGYNGHESTGATHDVVYEV